MAFIKDWLCPNCGSTLGKWVRGKEYVSSYCFVCGKAKDGLVVLTKGEVQGLCYEEVMGIAGVELGWCGEILTRIHSPGRRISFYGVMPFIEDGSGRIPILDWFMPVRRMNDKRKSLSVYKNDRRSPKTKTGEG